MFINFQNHEKKYFLINNRAVIIITIIIFIVSLLVPSLTITKYFATGQITPNNNNEYEIDLSNLDSGAIYTFPDDYYTATGESVDTFPLSEKKFVLSGGNFLQLKVPVLLQDQTSIKITNNTIAIITFNRGLDNHSSVEIFNNILGCVWFPQDCSAFDSSLSPPEYANCNVVNILRDSTISVTNNKFQMMEDKFYEMRNESPASNTDVESRFIWIQSNISSATEVSSISSSVVVEYNTFESFTTFANAKKRKISSFCILGRSAGNGLVDAMNAKKISISHNVAWNRQGDVSVVLSGFSMDYWYIWNVWQVLLVNNSISLTSALWPPIVELKAVNVSNFELMNFNLGLLATFGFMSSIDIRLDKNFISVDNLILQRTAEIQQYSSLHPSTCFGVWFTQSGGSNYIAPGNPRNTSFVGFDSINEFSMSENLFKINKFDGVLGNRKLEIHSQYYKIPDLVCGEMKVIFLETVPTREGVLRNVDYFTFDNNQVYVPSVLTGYFIYAHMANIVYTTKAFSMSHNTVSLLGGLCRACRAIRLGLDAANNVDLIAMNGNLVTDINATDVTIDFDPALSDRRWNELIAVQLDLAPDDDISNDLTHPKNIAWLRNITSIQMKRNVVKIFKSGFSAIGLAPRSYFIEGTELFEVAHNEVEIVMNVKVAAIIAESVDDAAVGTYLFGIQCQFVPTRVNKVEFVFNRVNITQLTTNVSAFAGKTTFLAAFSIISKSPVHDVSGRVGGSAQLINISYNTATFSGSYGDFYLSFTGCFTVTSAVTVRDIRNLVVSSNQCSMSTLALCPPVMGCSAFVIVPGASMGISGILVVENNSFSASPPSSHQLLPLNTPDDVTAVSTTPVIRFLAIGAAASTPKSFSAIPVPTFVLVLNGTPIDVNFAQVHVRANALESRMPADFVAVVGMGHITFAETFNLERNSFKVSTSVDLKDSYSRNVFDIISTFVTVSTLSSMMNIVELVKQYKFPFVVGTVAPMVSDRFTLIFGESIVIQSNVIENTNSMTNLWYNFPTGTVLVNTDVFNIEIGNSNNNNNNNNQQCPSLTSSSSSSMKGYSGIFLFNNRFKSASPFGQLNHLPRNFQTSSILPASARYNNENSVISFANANMTIFNGAICSRNDSFIYSSSDVHNDEYKLGTNVDDGAANLRFERMKTVFAKGGAIGMNFMTLFPSAASLPQRYTVAQLPKIIQFDGLVLRFDCFEKFSSCGFSPSGTDRASWQGSTDAADGASPSSSTSSSSFVVDSPWPSPLTRFSTPVSARASAGRTITFRSSSMIFTQQRSKELFFNFENNKTFVAPFVSPFIVTSLLYQKSSPFNLVIGGTNKLIIQECTVDFVATPRISTPSNNNNDITYNLTKFIFTETHASCDIFIHSVNIRNLQVPRLPSNIFQGNAAETTFRAASAATMFSSKSSGSFVTPTMFFNISQLNFSPTAIYSNGQISLLPPSLKTTPENPLAASLLVHCFAVNDKQLCKDSPILASAAVRPASFEFHNCSRCFELDPIPSAPQNSTRTTTLPPISQRTITPTIAAQIALQLDNANMAASDTTASATNVLLGLAAISGASAGFAMSAMRALQLLDLAGCPERAPDGQAWLDADRSFPATLFPGFGFGDRHGFHHRGALVSFLIGFIVAAVAGVGAAVVKHKLDSKKMHQEQRAKGHSMNVTERVNRLIAPMSDYISVWIVRFCVFVSGQVVVQLGEAAGLIMIGSVGGGDVALSSISILLVLAAAALLIYLVVVKYCLFSESLSSNGANQNKKLLEFVAADLFFMKKNASGFAAEKIDATHADSAKLTAVQRFVVSPLGRYCFIGEHVWKASGAQGRLTQVPVISIVGKARGCERNQQTQNQRNKSSKNPQYDQRHGQSRKSQRPSLAQGIRTRFRRYISPLRLIVLGVLSVITGFCAGVAKRYPSEMCPQMLAVTAVLNVVVAFVQLLVFPGAIVHLRSVIELAVDISTAVISVIIAAALKSRHLVVENPGLVTFVTVFTVVVALGSAVVMMVLTILTRFLVMQSKAVLEPCKNSSRRRNSPPSSAITTPKEEHGRHNHHRNRNNSNYDYYHDEMGQELLEEYSANVRLTPRNTNLRDVRPSSSRFDAKIFIRNSRSPKQEDDYSLLMPMRGHDDDKNTKRKSKEFNNGFIEHRSRDDYRDIPQRGRDKTDRKKNEKGSNERKNKNLEKKAREVDSFSKERAGIRSSSGGTIRRVENDSLMSTPILRGNNNNKGKISLHRLPQSLPQKQQDQRNSHRLHHSQQLSSRTEDDEKDQYRPKRNSSNNFSFVTKSSSNSDHHRRDAREEKNSRHRSSHSEKEIAKFHDI